MRGIESGMVYPDTPDGKSSAQQLVGDEGWWEEHVDLTSSGDDVVSRRSRVVQAMKQGADVSPALMREVGIEPVVDGRLVETTGELPDELPARMVNDGGTVDVPEVPRAVDPHWANLPA